MICPFCRNEVSNEVDFCSNCGNNVKQNSNQLVMHQNLVMNENNNYNKQNKSNKKNIVISIIIVVLLIVFTIFGTSKFFSSRNGNVNNEETDSNINLNYDRDGAFLMYIDSVFSITGRGTVVSGKIARGTVHVNDKIQIIGFDKNVITTTVEAIEYFKEKRDSAEIGESIGITLKNINRDDVCQGQVLAQPNSIRTSNQFEVAVSFYEKEITGGTFQSSFYLGGVLFDGTYTILDNDIRNGNVKATVKLDDNIAIDSGIEIRFYENRSISGYGTVTKVN